MDVHELRHQYEERLSLFSRLEEEALFILKPALEERGIKIHSLTYRVKTVESFLEKVRRQQSNKPFNDIQDMVGLRVVCLFLSDIPRIGEAIRESFAVLSEDDKVEGYDASSFGYLSHHFVVALPEECSGPRYVGIVGLPFEIQVRTIAMHAWATISHYLDYKTEIDVPKELRRDFYALSGLFYVADTHFEMFFKSRQKSRKTMAEVFQQPTPELDQEINLDSLSVYLHRRLPDREQLPSADVSALVEELAQAGFTRISDIEHALNVAWDAFLLWEEEAPPLGETGEKFADVGVIRRVLELVSEDFCRSRGGPITDEELTKYRNMPRG